MAAVHPGAPASGTLKEEEEEEVVVKVKVSMYMT
jgi:hypothetical protein